jgi:UDP-N-acetylmuramate: L-alanyl-gamma-D-glutamyl-meso-diaminopimelate ligase
MGSIALLAKQLGHDVSGSDQNVYPPMSDQLSAAGIQLAAGYHANNIPATTDLVIIGNAGLPRGNEAVEYVLDKGLPYTSGAEWLGRYLLADRWVIAIAGTHGKTTTTSMVAWILERAGLAPGFLVGGVPANFSVSSRLGSAPFFVIEADEYDTSYFDRRSKFLHYRPRTLVLNNLEFDHADIFPDLAAIQNQFHLLLRTVPGSGLIIHPAGDANLAAVFEKGCWTPRIAFTSDTLKGNVHYESLAADASAFDVMIDDKVVGRVQWALSGTHNLHNGLAAIAAAGHAGVDPHIACEALCEFEGVKRRMECIYRSATVSLYDDFAHHPTAIRTTLEGLRNKVGDEPILAIIEPGSHTMRRGTHAPVLADAAALADRVIWFRPETVDWSMDDALKRDNSIILDSIDGILATAIDATGAGIRHIVIMSNSGFGGLSQRLKQRLQSGA